MQKLKKKYSQESAHQSSDPHLSTLSLHCSCLYTDTFTCTNSAPINWVTAWLFYACLRRYFAKVVHCQNFDFEPDFCWSERGNTIHCPRIFSSLNDCKNPCRDREKVLASGLLFPRTAKIRHKAEWKWNFVHCMFSADPIAGSCGSGSLLLHIPLP